MKKLAFAAVFVAAVMLVACGGGGGDDDGVTLVDSGPIQTQCDPIAQTGCAADQKCAQLLIADGAQETTCVPNGNVALGEPCAYGDVGETTGFDDCEAAEGQGAQCINGVCRQICEAESCNQGFACDFYESLFDDITTSRVGVCNEECNPVAQDCAVDGEACYLNVTNTSGQGTCTAVPEGIADLAQGDECAGPAAEPSLCYSNGCGEGFHPFIIDDTPETTDDRALCTAYCQPVDTYIIDPDGDGTGDPTGSAVGFDDANPDTPDVSCSADRIGPAAHECRFFQVIIFADIGAIDYIPAEYGFCVDSTNVFWGSCASASNSEEQIIRVFDEAENATPNSGGTAIDDFCTANPDACPRFCISLAKQDELLTAYCASPTRVDPSAACTGRSRYLLKRREWEVRGMPSILLR